MTASMAPAAMKSATSTTVEATTAYAVGAAGGKSASNRVRTANATAIGNWPSAVTGASVAVARVSISRPSIVAAAIAVVTAITIAVVPGTRADKDAAAKPRRAVIPIGRASVGIVTVVAISADGSGIPVASIHRTANSNAN
jgi:hypothetical protein